MCDQGSPNQVLREAGMFYPTLEYGVGRTVTKGEDFHAERAREAVEGIVGGASGGDVDAGVVHQVLADPSQVRDDVDAADYRYLHFYQDVPRQGHVGGADGVTGGAQVLNSELRNAVWDAFGLVNFVGW